MLQVGSIHGVNPFSGDVTTHTESRVGDNSDQKKDPNPTVL